MGFDNSLKLTVAIPCYNEAKTIAKVVGDFKRVLPEARVFVFDNNSSDGSGEIARNAGAAVEAVRKQGKGNVMRAIFDKVDADFIIIVDGDDTYCAEDAPLLLKAIIDNHYDMVVGDRLNNSSKPFFKKTNLLGNYLISFAINRLFSADHRDVLSGYRVFGKRFVKRIALLTGEFETEVELTLRALEEKLAVGEVPVSYRSRPDDSRSKLKPFRDGVRIMIAAAMILRDVYPLRLYGVISLACFAAALAAAVFRPNAALLLFFILVGMIAFGMGLILSAVNARFSEIKQIIMRNK